MPDLLSALANANALKKVTSVPTTPGTYLAEILLVAAADGQRCLARWNGSTWERYALPGEVSRAGTPVGAVTPIAVGVLLRDTSVTPNKLWVSTGLANTNWVQVGGGGSGGAVEGTDVKSTGEDANLVLTSDGSDGATWSPVPDGGIPVYKPGSLPVPEGTGNYALLKSSTVSGLDSLQLLQDYDGFYGPVWAKSGTISFGEITTLPISSAGAPSDHKGQILRHRITNGLDTWWVSTDTNKAVQIGGPLYPLIHAVSSPSATLQQEYHGTILKYFGYVSIFLPDVDWVLHSQHAWWCEVFNTHPTTTINLVPTVPGSIDGATTVPPLSRVKIVQYRLYAANRWLVG